MSTSHAFSFSVRGFIPGAMRDIIRDMLKLPVLHPEILSALASAGHLSKILISDGNYPHITAPNPRAKIVWANFTPGVLDGVTVLKMIADLVPIEVVEVMAPATDGLYAMKNDPPIWERYERVLRERGFTDAMMPLTKPFFNEAARADATCLVIATAETEIYANVLVTIGVVR